MVTPLSVVITGQSHCYQYLAKYLKNACTIKLYAFLEKYNIIHKRQFGFREKYSTNYALASLIKIIKKYLDENNFVCGIFIDLKKEFDTVDHQILLIKSFIIMVLEENAMNGWNPF